MNNSFYDRMSRQQGWSLQRLTNKALFIVARQPIAQMLSLFGVCIGFNKQIIVAPELEEAFDVVSANLTHNPDMDISATTPEIYKIDNDYDENIDGQAVVLIDAGEPAFLTFNPPENAIVIAFGSDINNFFFGADIKKIRESASNIAILSRAELIMLAGEIFNTLCAELKVYKDPATDKELERGIEITTIPLTPLSNNTTLQPLNLYVGGFGGTISHQFFWAASFDHYLQQMFGPQSVITGADPDLVEVSNRSRQVGYSYLQEMQPKAKATATWLNQLFPHAQINGIQERISADHFANQAYNVCLSSVDTWTARRELANMCGKYEVPLWLSAGASFFWRLRKTSNRQYCMSLSAWD